MSDDDLFINIMGPPIARMESIGMTRALRTLVMCGSTIPPYARKSVLMYLLGAHVYIINHRRKPRSV